jgi:hypothetical protein
MFYVSEIKTGAPESFSTPLQERTYGALASWRYPSRGSRPTRP